VRYSQILVENRRFNLPHLYLAPQLGVTAFEFRRDLWHQKTRRIALSCGIKNTAGRFFGLVTKHACARRTDGQTDRQNYDFQDRASIAASRGKKRFALCYRTVVLSCPVCDVGAVWPNGWTDQDETWHAGRPRPWPHFAGWRPSSLSP